MTRNLKGSLLIASMLVVLWTTSSEACHRHRACQPAPVLLSIGVRLREPHRLLHFWPGGLRCAGRRLRWWRVSWRNRWLLRLYRLSWRVRPVLNPGGIGGPASGLGVRPGLGFGGFGRGADRIEVLRSPSGAVPTWNRGFAGAALLRSVDARPGRLPPGQRQVRRSALQPTRPGVTPFALGCSVESIH